MEETTYKVYIRADDSNRVTAINSSAFLSDLTGWIEVDEGTGDRYHHAQGNYLEQPLVDCEGLYNYAYIDGALSLRTDADKEADRIILLLPTAKLQRIAESKTALATWLRDNPMMFTDGKFYSVTEEKQTLLNSNLASYERANKAGYTYPLKWNATGEECTEWLYSDLLALSLAIAGYVAPKVATQQAAEVTIKGCNSLAELEAVVVDYN